MTQLNFLAFLDQKPLLSCVVTPDNPEFSELVSAMAKSKALCIDLETGHNKENTGNGLDPARGVIRLIQVLVPSTKKVMVVDMFKQCPDYFLKVLLKQLQNPDCCIVGHNLYFDLRWFRFKYNVRTTYVRDTRIMSQVLWAGIKSYRHGLAPLYKRLFGRELSKELQTSDWNQPVLSNSQINYAAEDVIKTWQCLLELSTRISAFDGKKCVTGQMPDYSLKEVATIECEAIPAFVEIAFNGLPINLPFAKETLAKYDKVIKDFFMSVSVKLGLPYSANSDNLVKAIYKQYGIWLLDVDKTQTGDEEELDLDDIAKKVTQLNLFGEVYPEVPKGMLLSTASSTLFNYYCQTKNEDLLILSLTRSLKKCRDAISALIESAEQNNGYARGAYNSLGFTSTGRSTCGGDGKSTNIALNLQNLPNAVEHPLVDVYKLPAPREVIQSHKSKKLVILDLSAAHSRYCVRFSEDVALLETLSLKDPHLLMTSVTMNIVNGTNLTVTDLLDRGGKKDPEIATYRALSKTCYYLSLNVGGAKRLQQVFAKSFSDVSLEQCELAVKGFGSAFPDVVKYQRNLVVQASKNFIEIPIKRKNGGTYKEKYAQFLTRDGRLIHLLMWKKERTNKRTGEKEEYWQPKISDCTSCMMISAEALAEKKSLADIMKIIHKYPDSHLVGFTHDEINLHVPDNNSGFNFTKEVYEINARNFTESLGGYPSGMAVTEKTVRDSMVDNYSEK